MDAHRPRTPATERTRRWFMNRSLLLGGAAAVATMTGCSAGSAGTNGSASGGAESETPSGGPGGGGGMGPGATAVKYADFKGVTTGGTVVDDLFSIHSTGVSTDAVVKAAQAFLDGLGAKVRRASVFDVDDDEWLAWSNVDGYDARAPVWAI
ncbi:hypothetical protein [Streptomyces rubrogriseus]|uniref:hypothetical protein n=1 Tax=Streptomyces rubrogriseus TaxID=194673 RepID=UPI00364D4F37